MKLFFRCSILLTTLSIFIISSSCSPDEVRPNSQNAASFGNSKLKIKRGGESTITFKGGPHKICGKMIAADLISNQNLDVGNLAIANNEDSMYVTMIAEGKWQFEAVDVFVGSCDNIPTDGSGFPDPTEFPQKIQFKKSETLKTISWSRASIDSCVCVLLNVHAVGSAGAKVEAWSSGFLAPGTSFTTGYVYCMQDCSGKCQKDLRTQTQASWGTGSAVGSAGAYLNSNWSTAFPAGIAVGCPAGYSVTLTSPSSTADFLPSNGSPMILFQQWTDPAQQLKNPLIGEIVALTISLGFDTYIPNFGSAPEQLGSMKVINGPFQGWDVSQVLAEANNAVGGCGTKYMLNDIFDCLRKINENYMGGVVDKGYLTCP